MLFRDIRNNRNNRRRSLREAVDRTNTFDSITVEDKGLYILKIKFDFVMIEIEYDSIGETASIETSITSSVKTMNNLVREPELLREIADFMEPLLDQNGKIDTEVLEGILVDNNM